MASEETNIRTQLASSTAILVTGAGFSAGLRRSRDKKPLPLGPALAKDVWPLAFPGEPYEPGESLQGIYEEAYRKSPSELRDLINETFSVDASSIPERFVD